MNKNNPYPEFLVDEVSGITVPDMRHQVWEEGYKAGREVRIWEEGYMHRVREKEDVGLFTSGAGLGKQLRVMRATRGITMRKLAEISGVSFSEISRIEKGFRSPHLRIVAKLEKALKGGEAE